MFAAQHLPPRTAGFRFSKCSSRRTAAEQPIRLTGRIEGNATSFSFEENVFTVEPPPKGALLFRQQRIPPVPFINTAKWPGQDPLGQIILNACGPERRVIGVVGDVRHLALEESSGNEMYLPIRQCGDYSSADLVGRLTLAPASLARAIRAALKPLAPNLAGNDFRTVQQIVDRSVSSRRFLVLLGAFATFALVLVSLGIYGLISYSVNQRVAIRLKRISRRD